MIDLATGILLRHMNCNCFGQLIGVFHIFSCQILSVSLPSYLVLYMHQFHIFPIYKIVNSLNFEFSVHDFLAITIASMGLSRGCQLEQAKHFFRNNIKSKSQIQSWNFIQTSNLPINQP